MKSKYKNRLIELSGILIGAFYGLFVRFLIQESSLDNSDILEFEIYSVSFFWILPIAIGLIPILIARKAVLEHQWKWFYLPTLSVLLFFQLALITRLEDMLCILIVSFPFLISAGIIGLILGPILKSKHANKLSSIVLLPFIFSPLESYLPRVEESFHVESKISIEADKTKVWDALIEVPEIKSEEYNAGFYNRIGIPRPIKSTLETVDEQVYRIGYFTEGLKLYETISNIDTNHFVEFKIHIDKSELRNVPTDEHVLDSKYFKFDRIAYQVIEKEGGTELRLSCTYTLHSNMNWYAEFWANEIISDFEERLLQALKFKLEKQWP